MRKHTTIDRRRLRMEILGLRPALNLDDLQAMRAHRFDEDYERIAALTNQPTRRLDSGEATDKRPPIG